MDVEAHTHTHWMTHLDRLHRLHACSRMQSVWLYKYATLCIDMAFSLHTLRTQILDMCSLMTNARVLWISAGCVALSKDQWDATHLALIQSHCGYHYEAGWLPWRFQSNWVVWWFSEVVHPGSPLHGGTTSPSWCPGSPNKKDSLNLRIHKAVQHWTPRQSGQLVDTHDPLSTRPLGATAPQHLRCVFSFAIGRSCFTGSCYTWNTWSHSCVKHAVILLSKNQEVEFLEQCWVPMGDLTQVFAMKLGNHTHFPYVPRSNFAWWNWENTHFFWHWFPSQVVVLLSAMMVLYGPAGGDVFATIDVQKPAEKTGQWHWKNLSFNRKYIDTKGGFSTVDG